MTMIDIALSVNGRRVQRRTEPRTQLSELLREDLNLTGTHVGCEQGVCGACTVIVDGKPQRSCISYAGDADGCSVTTIEGFDDDALMEELRNAFSKHHGLQCGFCTPGMLITARDIVLRLGDIPATRIREELSGNLCRCTGYVGIVEAIRAVCAGKQPAKTAPVATATARPMMPVAGTESLRAQEAAPAAAQSPVSARPSRQGWTSIEQTLRIASPPATVWAKLTDLHQVAACLPGAELTAVEGDRIEGRMNVALGPMKAAFKGAGTVTLDPEQHTGRMSGRGRDSGSGSTAEGEVTWRVAPGETGDEASSTVLVTLAWRLSGRLAQFNRAGLVQDIVTRMTSIFVTNLEASIRGEPTASVRAKPLSLWALIWSVLKGRILGDRRG